jgi:hypothetical protein
MATAPIVLPFADQIRQLHPTMGMGMIRMKTSGNTTLNADGKSGGGRGFAEAFQTIGLPEAPYFVWGAIR